MDTMAQAALRAIVAGLRESGAINEPHVRAIVKALEAADANAEKRPTMNDGGGRYSLRQLCMQIAGDAGVETAIKTAKPTN